MQHSEPFTKAAAAFCVAQGQFTAAKMTATNPHFRSKYAPFDEVMGAVRPALRQAGFAILQTVTDADAHGFNLTTTLLHTSGEWLAGSVRMPMGDTAQQVGSALTYARRYGLSALCGVVADDDDDGNAAQRPEPPKASAPRPAPRAPAPAGSGFVMPFGKTKGVPLTNLTDQDLQGALGWAQEKGKFEAFQEAAAAELERRAGGKVGARSFDQMPPELEEDEAPF